MNQKEKKLLGSFPPYDGDPKNFVGSREYWENVFSCETNRDPELHKAFGELHEKIVNDVIAFCKEHRLEVDEFCVRADGLRGSRDFGKWCPCTDSSMSMHVLKKVDGGRKDHMVVDRESPFLYEI